MIIICTHLSCCLLCSCWLWSFTFFLPPLCYLCCSGSFLIFCTCSCVSLFTPESNSLFLTLSHCLSSSFFSFSPALCRFPYKWDRVRAVRGLFGNTRGDRLPASRPSSWRLEAIRYRLSPTRFDTQPLSHLAARQPWGCRAAGLGLIL